MNKEVIYWKMRNGRLISVDEMDINHLRNVLKMIIRNREKAITITKGLDLDGNVVIHKHHHNNPKVKGNIVLNGDIAQSFINDMQDAELEEDSNYDPYNDSIIDGMTDWRETQ